MVMMLMDGISWKNISCVLNKEGVKSKKEGIWYDGSLYNMMKINWLKI